MIYLVIHLQNKISRRLLHWNCVVMHGGHIKRESDLKFTGPINKFHRVPSVAKCVCNVSIFMLDVSFSSSISHLCVFHPVTPCNYVHPCIEREKIWKQTHTRPGNTCRVSSVDIVLRDRAVDVTFFSKSPWRRFSPFLSTLYPQYLFSSMLHL